MQEQKHTRSYDARNATEGASRAGPREGTGTQRGVALARAHARARVEGFWRIYPPIQNTKEERKIIYTSVLILYTSSTMQMYRNFRTILRYVWLMHNLSKH